MAYSSPCGSLRLRSSRLHCDDTSTTRHIGRSSSRWRLPLHGRGKRGGLRLIYYWEPDQDVIYMLYLYAKNEQGDLTPWQMRVLKRLVREEFQ